MARKVFSAVAPAKLNLTLRVLRQRSDGFHELESLVAQTSLADTISVSSRDDGELTLSCDTPAVPTDETNLAFRAAQLLANTSGVTTGADIKLNKRIPAGAGLGGGSSDAATTLRLLNDLWSLDLPKMELTRLGAQLGSDVPLFFEGPLCVMRGRGDKIEPLNQPLDAWATLILPAIHSSTPAAYAAWDAQPQHPNRVPLSEVLAVCTQPERLMLILYNDLEEAVLTTLPALRAQFEQIQSLSDGPVRMTGSGSAFFRLFDQEHGARSFAEQIASQTDVRTEIVRVGTAVVRE